MGTAKKKPRVYSRNTKSWKQRIQAWKIRNLQRQAETNVRRNGGNVKELESNQ